MVDPAALDTVLILWAEAEAPPCSTEALRPGSLLSGDSEGEPSHLPAPAPGPLSAPPVPRSQGHGTVLALEDKGTHSPLHPGPRPLSGKALPMS